MGRAPRRQASPSGCGRAPLAACRPLTGHRCSRTSLRRRNGASRSSPSRGTRVHVIEPGDNRAKSRGDVVRLHSIPSLPDHDIAMLDGLLVTTLDRNRIRRHSDAASRGRDSPHSTRRSAAWRGQTTIAHDRTRWASDAFRADVWRRGVRRIREHAASVVLAWLTELADGGAQLPGESVSEVSGWWGAGDARRPSCSGRCRRDLGVGPHPRLRLAAPAAVR